MMEMTKVIGTVLLGDEWPAAPILVLAGTGGNGGGGICTARHLANHGGGGICAARHLANHGGDVTVVGVRPRKTHRRPG